MNKRIRPIIKCRTCHELKPHQGMGLCRKCYQKSNKIWNKMNNKEKEICQNNDNDLKKYYKNKDEQNEQNGRFIICKNCHQKRLHQQSGLCSTCYRHKREKWIRMSDKDKQKYRNNYHPYCSKFNESCKEKNREKYDRRCFICDKAEKDNGKRLSVHHIDRNKNQGCDGSKWSLIPVCSSCHSKLHNKLWQNRIEYLLK